MAVARIEEHDGEWRVAVTHREITTYLSPAEVMAVLRVEVPGGHRD